MEILKYINNFNKEHKEKKNYESIILDGIYQYIARTGNEPKFITLGVETYRNFQDQLLEKHFISTFHQNNEEGFYYSGIRIMVNIYANPKMISIGG